MKKTSLILRMHLFLLLLNILFNTSSLAQGENSQEVTPQEVQTSIVDHGDGKAQINEIFLKRFYVSYGNLYGNLIEGAVRLYADDFQDGREIGVYIVASYGDWQGAELTNRTDNSVPHDHITSYRRRFVQGLMQLESYFSTENNLGYTLGFGYRKEEGTVIRKYSNEASVPVFFGSKSRTEYRGTFDSGKIETSAVVLAVGGFLQFSNEHFKNTHFRVGINLLIPRYFNDKFQLQLPDDTTQTLSLNSSSVATGNTYTYMSILF
jgi:hypothetical protein